MSNQLNMDYNTARGDLVIPEYGRNVQNLIYYAKGIEDKEKRQLFVEQLVDLMLQLSPNSKNFDDSREKIWKHIFLIANYELDVKPPEGISPSPQDKKKKPERLTYSHIDTKFKHYGIHVYELIKKAISIEDKEVRDSLIQVIGSYMKLAYRTWNDEKFVNDITIINDLKALSNGKLILDEDVIIDNLAKADRQRKRKITAGRTEKNTTRKRYTKKPYKRR